MAFGKTFHTLKEARTHLKKLKSKTVFSDDLQIRKLSKKFFPRTKKRFHVGTMIDWLNF